MAQAREWVTERDSLVQERESIVGKVAQLDSKIKELDDRFSAAAVLSPAVGEMLFDTAGGDTIARFYSGDHEGNAGRQTPRRVGRGSKSGSAFRPWDMSQPDSAKNPNYLYIALKRLADRNEIEEVNGRFKAKRNSRGQGLG